MQRNLLSSTPDAGQFESRAELFEIGSGSDPNALCLTG